MGQILTWDKKIAEMLEQGSIGVVPTDTLYGIVGSALSKDIVERIYKSRRRNPKKPMIILIESLSQLKSFGVNTSAPRVKKILKQLWPGQVSIILPITRRGKFLAKFSYLHRGTGMLAFRMPEPKQLRVFLKKTGPLVAPSANFEGEPPATTIREAKKYFGDLVDFYLDGGRLDGSPSTLVQIESGRLVLLRQGAVKI